MAKILLVEDDALMARLYQKTFTFDGHEVVTAADGEEGLAKAKTEKPTLMLLDIMMPKMNGLDVLTRLKADPETKGIPVVVLTNLAGEHDAQEALTRGAIRYIVKSEQDPRGVTKIVEEILAGYTRGEVPKTATQVK
jgi:CheY-like chemotaxis protein